MIQILIGHRGTGKSQFLKSISDCFQKYNLDIVISDLDKEIEAFTKKTIREIFLNEGEAAFRVYEEKMLFKYFSQNIGENKHIVIALGAGYKEKLPESASVIWLRRSSDELGRIFLDRPRLDNQDTPLGEYFARFEKRNSVYKSLADEVLHLPENYKKIEPWVPIFWGIKPSDIGGCLTLQPWFLDDKRKTKNFLLKRLNWGVKYFEIRTDLLSLNQQQWVKEFLPDSMILWSVRGISQNSSKFANVDWPMELGVPPENINILSLHKRDHELAETLKKLSVYKNSFLKLAVEISNWEELKLGHSWWLEDPERRSFLPNSKNGRWEWYRLLHKYKMKINFFREDEGSSNDQPFFVDWVNYNEFSKNQFGAVIGNPIKHSWTPEEQRDYWASKNCNSLKIEMTEEEFCIENIQFLKSLGLRFAAVTAPLKKKAFLLSNKRSETAKRLNSANTLYFTENEIQSHNTDLEGLETAVKKWAQKHEANQNLKSLRVAVWGGGGTLSMIQEVFPNADFFSARTGKISKNNSLFKKWKSKNKKYDLLIWALGRERLSEGCVMPLEKFSFDSILDLNYTENSPGKELALLRNIEYFSGEDMFFEQARAQRVFWENCCEKT